MSFDLTQYSSSDLQTLVRDIEREIKSRASQTKKTAKAEILEITKKYNLTLDQIFGDITTESKEKAIVAPKYRNPYNENETWTGRGKKPVWLEKALAQGDQLESFLI